MKIHSDPLENGPVFKNFRSSPSWRTESILSFSCNSCIYVWLITFPDMHDAIKIHISLSESVLALLFLDCNLLAIKMNFLKREKA